MAEKEEKLEFIFKDLMHFREATKKKERAEAFGPGTSAEIISECLEKLTANKEIAIAKESRTDKYNDHVRIFKTNKGGLVAIPCYTRDDGKIEILTLINAHKAEDQSWFVNQYKAFAKEKQLQLANFKFTS